MNTRETNRLEADDARASFWLAVGLACFALFWQLGVRGLNEPDEGRYSSVAYEMFRSGNWIEPMFQGQLSVWKPPLIYWCMGACFKLFGVNEWAARLPSALAALGTVLLIWSRARRWFGPRHALYAALILVTSPLFFVMAHIADLNMLLTFCVTLGICSWLRWREDGRARDRWLFYLAHGLAFATKGPVGCILILFAVLSFHWLAREQLPRRRIWSWLGFGLACFLGLGWYFYIIHLHHELLDYFLRYELYDRVFTNVHKRSEPLLYFFGVIPVGFLPWLSLLALLIPRARAGLRRAFPEAPLLLALALALALFTISSSKLPSYVTPLYPLLALLGAAQLKHLSTRGTLPFRAIAIPVAACALILPIAFLLTGVFKRGWTDWMHSGHLLAYGLLLLALVIMVRQRAREWIVPAAVSLILAYVALLDIERRHESQMGGPSSVRAQVSLLRNEVATHPGPVYYLHAPQGFEFYLRGATPPTRLLAEMGKSDRPPEEYLEKLTAYAHDLAGKGAYVVASSHYLGQALDDNALPAGVQVLDRGRKFTILRVD